MGFTVAQGLLGDGIMKIGPLRVLGIWVLLIAMVVALVMIETVERWVGWWVLCVGLGVVLVLWERFVGKKRDRG